jgi:hypothetical protein
MLEKYDAQATKELQALVDSPRYNATTFDATIAELVVMRHADPNVTSPVYDMTPAMMAAGGGHTTALELLVNAGAKLDTQDKYGYTAAMLAAYYGNTQELELLIKAGTDVSLKTNAGNTALDCAIMNSEAKAISILVGKEVVGQKAMEACGAPKKGGLFASSSYKADDLRTLAALGLDDKPLGEVLGHIAAKHKDDLQKAYTSYLTSGKKVDDKVAKMVETALNTKYEKTKGSKEAEMDVLHLQQNPMEAKQKHRSNITNSSASLSEEERLTGGAHTPQANNPMATKAVKAAGQALAKDGATKAVEVDDKRVASLLKGFKKPAPVKGPTH